MSSCFVTCSRRQRIWGDWNEVRPKLSTWHWQRKSLASTVNILSFALYDLFSADDPRLAVLQVGCFKYFELGGECVNGPVSLLAGIAESPLLLARHFFSVALYAIWVQFTHPRPVKRADGKTVYATATIDEYPHLLWKSVCVFWTACVVFGPLLWSEIRWWAPSSMRTDSPPSPSFLNSSSLLVLLSVADS
ncbi:Squalene epoxidase [Pleurotus ostreatus]|nr:Squalene epoxidase [Pleurotus ostreatus]